MSSPYIRRRQLAAEIRKLREQHNLTCDDLARLVFHSRTKITRLENAQVRPDVGEIMNMLEALEITGTRYDRLLRLAREAAEKGWWDRYGMSMGPRQKLAADLEYNAATVRSYDQTAMPGALQCPEFVEALIELDQSQRSIDYQPARMAEARAARQRELLRPGGPSYETVMDECVIHRLGVPAGVMAAQIQHMLKIVREEAKITIRVLPHNAKVPGGFLPKSSFYLYTFPEAGDPPLGVVDTVTTDLVLTQKGEVARYTGIFNRLRDVALPTEDSIAFLEGVANLLMEQTGSGA